MPFYQRTVIAGKTIETKKYYSRMHKPKERRIKRKEQTKEAQENVNIRHQVERLRWLLNCNFEEGDMFVTFSIRKNERPDTYKELVKMKDKLIADLRREHKKADKVFKYVYVLETGDRGAAHIHMVLKSIDTKLLKRCWDRGYIHIKLLDGTGQYGELASYLVKEKGRKKMEKYGGKTYSPIEEHDTANHNQRSSMGEGFLSCRCQSKKGILYRQAS
ncbi:rolling circle replication-associated protein [Anaerostipes butyraticus]|uniref:Replication-associated protein ORF2/G2P domain-containing protein n=1 Tax=Anaerostipes butyraticus TaxID=645466 RepID=A0A916QBP2_9FIRM|nr:hypothetical protein [Anaerostipes butyraticus]GFO86535.1 hypothetical protein ANBU17_28820 [Anaerostipes butyraticus]